MLSISSSTLLESMQSLIENRVAVTDDYIIVYKESGLPTVPLKGQSGRTLLSEVASFYPEVLAVKGVNEWEGGTLHRLDTPTSGLVLFARTQRAFDYLYSEQKASRIEKTYRVTISKEKRSLEGFPPYPYKSPMVSSVNIESRFRAYGPKGRAVRPVTDNKRYQDGPIYSTFAKRESDDTLLCTIRKGFRHQIRCHMAWCGCQIKGDELYGASPSSGFGLEAIAISFIDRNGERVEYSISPRQIL